ESPSCGACNRLIVKHLVHIEKTDVVQIPQNLWIGFWPKIALAGLDDGAPEPAPNLAVVSYVFCILDRAHISSDFLLIASANWVDCTDLPVDDHQGRLFPR